MQYKYIFTEKATAMRSYELIDIKPFEYPEDYMIVDDATETASEHQTEHLISADDTLNGLRSLFDLLTQLKSWECKLVKILNSVKAMILQRRYARTTMVAEHKSYQKYVNMFLMNDYYEINQKLLSRGDTSFTFLSEFCVNREDSKNIKMNLDVDRLENIQLNERLVQYLFSLRCFVSRWGKSRKRQCLSAKNQRKIRVEHCWSAIEKKLRWNWITDCFYGSTILIC